MRLIKINQITRHIRVAGKNILKNCGMITSVVFILHMPAQASDDARFSQVSFNDMITQTIRIGHGHNNSSQFNTKNMTHFNSNTNAVLVTQNEPVVNTNVSTANSINNHRTSVNIKSSDFANIQTAKSSLAVMHALSEICPQLLNRNQLSAFNRGFDNKLKSMLPNIRNPKAAMSYLSTQQDYRRVLSNMKAWQMSISDAENLAVCNDILSYR